MLSEAWQGTKEGPNVRDEGMNEAHELRGDTMAAMHCVSICCGGYFLMAMTKSILMNVYSSLPCVRHGANLTALPLNLILVTTICGGNLVPTLEGRKQTSRAK